MLALYVICYFLFYSFFWGGGDSLVDVPIMCKCEFDNCMVRLGARIDGSICSNVASFHMT